MNRERLISVIVPTHNSETYIVECMHSIMNQTYRNLQIICVDSSKDRTVAILEELREKDARIQIIQDNNSSYGYKINTGIRLARGDYIGIVESDDYIRLEMYKDMLENLQDEMVDYVKCAADYFMDVNGQRFFEKNQSEIIEKNVDRIIDLAKEPDFAWMEIPKIWSALYRRSFLSENDIWLNETPGASYQDTSFSMLVAVYAKTCVYKEGAYYCYRNDNINSSVKSSSKVLCVCDEYEYLKTTLMKKQKYVGDVYRRILKEKLYTYSWNIKRLNVESCEVFRKHIQNELEECREVLKSCFHSNDLSCLDILSNQRALEQYWKENEAMIEQWSNFINLVKAGNKFVLIGAGNIGTKVVFLQKIYNDNFIFAIGDNYGSGLSDELRNCIVESVQSVVDKYPQSKYVIANKKSYKKIRKQLEDLGVSETQILELSKNIGKIQLLELYKKYL